MSIYLGDFPTSAVIDFKWTTNDADGESITRATNGTISVYKANSTTQTTTGVTDTEDFDSLTGVHHCRIDTSADGTFYAAGNNFQVVLSAATIDGETVNAVIAHFSIQHRYPSTTVIQAVVNAALVALGLDHLVNQSVSGADVADNSIVARLTSKSGTADWDSYNNTTDSLEALRDNQQTAAQAGSNAALIALGLDHLVSTSVAGADVADNSIVARLVSKEATADWDDFDNSSDSLQALGEGVADKTGYKLASDGMDLVEAPANTPGAEPDTFLTMHRAMFQRMFGNVELDIVNGELRTYLPGGSGADDVLAVQDVSEDESEQVQGEADWPSPP